MRIRTLGSTSCAGHCRHLFARSRKTPVSSGSIVVGKVMGERSGAFGYDAQGDEYGDMIEKGIIDPAKVVRIALQDAASIAGLMITTEAGVAEVEKVARWACRPRLAA